MTSAQTPPDPQAGGVVLRCAAGHAETYRPPLGVKARCPYRDPASGEKCRKLAYVPAALRRGPAPAIMPGAAGAAASGGLWPGEAPPAPWRDLLGEAVAGVSWCADNGCPCDGPPMRYTNGHTVIACPDLRCPDCWDVSPAVMHRAEVYAATLRRVAARTGQRSPGVTQAQADARARELHRVKARLGAAIAGQLADRHLTADSRADLEWFGEAIGSAATIERAAELAAELRDLEVSRVPWWQRIGPGRLDDDGGEDQAADDEDAVLPHTPELRALPAGGRWAPLDELTARAARTGQALDEAELQRALYAAAWPQAGRPA